MTYHSFNRYFNWFKQFGFVEFVEEAEPDYPWLAKQRVYRLTPLGESQHEPWLDPSGYRQEHPELEKQQYKPASKPPVRKPVKPQPVEEEEEEGEGEGEEGFDRVAEVAAAFEKLSGYKRPNSAAADKVLDQLEEKEIDVDDARGALEEYTGIERSDFDDAEEYRDERQTAWEAFLEAVQEIGEE